MTIRLRPHHLLCVLTYVGKGYNPDFVANLDATVERLNAGEPITIVEGPDDICRPQIGRSECHCFEDSVWRRDAQALAAVTDLLGTTSFTYDDATVEGLRAAFASGSIRTACRSCEWDDLCSAIASSGFEGVKLRPGTAEPSDS